MRLLDVRREEIPALAWAAAWFFCVLAAYYTIRPVRETFVVEIPRDQRATLFTVTLLVMVIATPLYGLVVTRISKRWLVPVVYGFFITHLFFFGLAFANSNPSIGVSKAFFVWISVFNLYVVTLFWGTAVDLFSGQQGKRLFGLVFGAGTLGQLLSLWGVQATSAQMSSTSLLWVSAAFLLAAIFCSWKLRKLMSGRASAKKNVTPKGKNSWTLAWQGVTAVVRSPYLLGIALVIVALSGSATVVYFLMTDLVAEQISDPGERLQWFAKINAIHAGVTLLLQTAVVGWLLQKMGVGLTMALVPAIYLAGFATLAWTQTLFVIGLFQVALRAAAFSFGNPALEVLYTAVASEQKYRAKAFIDTVGKRTGDVLGAQACAVLGALGWAISTLSLAMLPIVLGLIALCFLLGSAHQQATDAKFSEQ